MFVSCSGRNRPIKVFAEPRGGPHCVWLCGTHRHPHTCVLPRRGECGPSLPGRGESHPHGSHSAWGVSLRKGVLSAPQRHGQQERGHWHPTPMFWVLVRLRAELPASSLPGFKGSGTECLLRSHPEVLLPKASRLHPSSVAPPPHPLPKFLQREGSTWLPQPGLRPPPHPSRSRVALMRLCWLSGLPELPEPWALAWTPVCQPEEPSPGEGQVGPDALASRTQKPASEPGRQPSPAPLPRHLRRSAQGWTAQALGTATGQRDAHPARPQASQLSSPGHSCTIIFPDV